jgi:hypothetical protein
MCTVTTRDIEDLKLTGDMERGQQAEVVRTHGTAVIPSVLKPETAAALRKAMYEQSSQDWADGKQIDGEIGRGAKDGRLGGGLSGAMINNLYSSLRACS